MNNNTLPKNNNNSNEDFSNETIGLNFVDSLMNERTEEPNMENFFSDFQDNWPLAEKEKSSTDNFSRKESVSESKAGPSKKIQNEQKNSDKNSIKLNQGNTAWSQNDPKCSNSFQNKHQYKSNNNINPQNNNNHASINDNHLREPVVVQEPLQFDKNGNSFILAPPPPQPQFYPYPTYSHSFPPPQDNNCVFISDPVFRPQWSRSVVVIGTSITVSVVLESVIVVIAVSFHDVLFLVLVFCFEVFCVLSCWLLFDK